MRRRFGISLIAVLASLESTAQISDLNISPRTIGDVVRVAGRPSDNSGARRPLNVLQEGAASIVFVYGAANANGRFGAYYRTDLDIAGSGVGNGSIAFDLYVLPANTDNTSSVGRRYSIRDNAFITIKDVVGNAGVLGGATIVLASVPSQTTAIGAHSLLSVWGTTYTAAPTGGNYLTALPVTAGYLISPTSSTQVSGVVSTGGKRTNINVFNHSYQTATYRVDVSNEEGTYLGDLTVTTPPLSSVQRALDAFSIGEPGGNIVFSTVDGAGSAFAVVVDNATNDGDAKLASYRESAPCPNVGGSYTAFFANSCGFTGSEPVFVQQTGCTVSVETSFGSVSGNLIYGGGQFTIQWSTCSGSATGAFHVYPTGISAIFAGDARGGNCCENVSGSIFLPRAGSNASCNAIPPSATYVSPTNFNQDGSAFGGPLGTTQTVTVTGANFQAPVAVTLIKDGAPVSNTPVNNANVSSPTSLTFAAPAVSNASLNQQNCLKSGSVIGLKYVPTSFGIRVTNTQTSCSADLPNALVYNPTDTSCH